MPLWAVKLVGALPVTTASRILGMSVGVYVFVRVCVVTVTLTTKYVLGRDSIIQYELVPIPLMAF